LIRNDLALAERRKLLHAWVAAWYGRHERQLASEGVRFPVRVGRATLLVTSEQALAAISRTVQELDTRLADHPGWGCDEHGRTSELAMRGLINRRLTCRLVDQLRRPTQISATSLASPAPGLSDSELSLADTVAGSSDLGTVEAKIWLEQILIEAPQTTRAIVLRRLYGESAKEISVELGLNDAATRQRMSRFRRQHCGDLVDAA
jgi:hypothetical protein